MQYDVFVSYSSKDKAIADALVHFLEEAKVRCWIAPRDIPAGADYAEVIDDAIRDTTIMLVLFSGSSQKSVWCKKEVNLAVSCCRIILPVKIDDAALTGAMHLYLSDKHWVDAVPEPEIHFAKIRDSVLRLLNDPSVPSESSAGERASPPQKLWQRMLYHARFGLGGMFVSFGCTCLICYPAEIALRGAGIEWVTIVVMCLMLVVGPFLLRRKLTACVTRDSLECLKPLRFVKNVLRTFLGGWAWTVGMSFILYFPFWMIKVQDKSVHYKTVLTVLLCNVCLSGWGLALAKSGLAMLESDWVKFSFTARKFLKWAFIITLPMLLLIILAGIFDIDFKGI